MFNEDYFIDNLLDIIEHKYQGIECHVVYGKPSKIIGEIDVLALRSDGYYDAYEVKSTMNGHKQAKSQLRRAKNKFTKGCIIDTYIYIGIEDLLIKYTRK